MSYKEQQERMIRWKKKLDNKSVDTKTYEDFLIAFFQNCYHLKDWIINDSSINIDNESVENYVTNNDDLRLCSGIANGTKHFILKNKQRIKDEFKLIGKKTIQAPHCVKSTIIEQYSSLGKTNKEVVEGNALPQDIDKEEYILGKEYFIIDDKQDKKLLLSLAGNCIEAWEKFLEKNKLID